MNLNINEIFQYLSNAVIEYGPKLLGAILVWIIGSIIIKKLINVFGKTLDKRDTDESLKPFLKSIISILLKVLLVISVLSMLGVAMTSFIAILGAAGLAVGMALSGTLQNFAGGVIILLFKPFKVGDFIDAQGYKGTVKEIQIFNTILTDLDNKTIIIPNGGLSTNSMVNYSTEPTRRVDISVGIAYGESVEKSREVLNELGKNDKRVLNDPAPFIGVTEMADSSINLTFRIWVNAADYWGVYFDMNENVYNAFNQAGIQIPFPQVDVHLQK
ncbi:MAG: mechanosensitive ion channel [Flavobacteriaceae bacterium]|nr:mechanosensitive ion channel [Flavobacteriaceae bacterium]